MKNIIYGIIDKFKLEKLFPGLIKKIYKFDNPEILKIKIKPLIDILRDDLYFYIEYPYVDKVYRDSYYFYFSSKHTDYFRNCVRISIFSRQINKNYFRNEKYFNFLQDSYLGFLIIRPTFPNIIGRSMISPKALNNNNFLSCITSIETMVNGVKLKVEGFPHSSQDGESISCAETTIWSMMEYYGTKYNEYKTILPSEIIEKLTPFSVERLIPSQGLTINQISYIIKQFGFYPRIYSSKVYDKKEFRRIVFNYIESGIPLIASLNNDKIGHAVIFCGHEKIDLDNFVKPLPDIIIREDNSELKIYDAADINKKITVIDDNLMPYQLVDFDNPTCNYNDINFKDCQINTLVVPLYKKIYIEATIAREMVINILKDKDIGIKNNEVLLRLFLTSSRSFKNKVASNPSFDEKTKDMIILSTMPKFIWVAELSNFDLYKDKKANGLLIIDATAGKFENIFNSTIIIFYQDYRILFDKNKLTRYNLTLNNYEIFENNLKGF